MVEASIIIPTYNRNIIANTCIGSILGSLVLNIEIIVVNDSKNEQFTLGDTYNSNLITIVNNPRQGVASARNFGAKLAKSEWLIFIDDDMIVNSAAISASLNFLKKNERCTYNSNWIYPEDLMFNLQDSKFGRYLINQNYTSLKGWNHGTLNWIEDSIFKANGITSQFFAIRKKDFVLIGGYNESFPFAGFEDYDFYQRMKSLRIENYIDTTVLIFHNERDRLNVLSWLKRKERGSLSRKMAVKLGYLNLNLTYGKFKSFLFETIIRISPLLRVLLLCLPNVKSFDKIYNRVLNVLTGAYMYKGYTK